MGISPYKISKIDSRTWIIEEKAPMIPLLAPCCIYLLEGNETALLIDTGMGMGDLRDLVSRLTKKPVSVVNTHGHVDHVGRNYQFDTVSIHKDDREVVELHRDRSYLIKKLRGAVPGIVAFFLIPLLKNILDRPMRDNYHYIGDGCVFDLGGRKIEVIHTPGHTPGSICLLEEAAGILYSGDMVCGRILLNQEFSLGPEVFLTSMERLLRMKDRFTAIYPGHPRSPVEPDYIEKLRVCADGVLDGSLPVKGISFGGDSSLEAEYEGVHVILKR
ncbi:MAG: MBL fold metallo-hydrolase [Treponema sp.]|nr:MBL fold metallo-hydrolase [Treponema sp.]